VTSPDVPRSISDELCYVDEFGHKGQGPVVVMVGFLAGAAGVRDIISGHIQLLASRLLTNVEQRGVGLGARVQRSRT
jgi:hypothetical protein